MKNSIQQKNAATFLNATLLEYMVSVGIASCLIGISYCWIPGNNVATMAVNIFGFILLVYLKIRYKNSMTQTMGCVVILYFCFLFTPFVWISSGGMESNITYGVFVLCFLIIVVLDGKLQKVMLYAYLSLVAVFTIHDFMEENISVLVYQKAFVFSVVLVVMIIMLAAIKNQMLATNEQIIKVALTDELSGAFNARYLKEKIYELEQTYRNDKKNYCVAMLDIDDFKMINDTYGHLYGDEVIRLLAVQIRKTADEKVLLCRYGGDEFILIFTEGDKKGACKICENVRNKIQAEPISDKQIHATISMGVCERSEVKDGEDILCKIDELLYESKKNGKNKVVYR